MEFAKSDDLVVTDRSDVSMDENVEPYSLDESTAGAGIHSFGQEWLSGPSSFSGEYSSTYDNSSPPMPVTSEGRSPGKRSTTLMGLCRELRSLILGHVLGYTIINVDLVVHGPGNTYTPSFTPDVMRVCKQLRAEAGYMFIRQTVFELPSPSSTQYFSAWLDTFSPEAGLGGVRALSFPCFALASSVAGGGVDQSMAMMRNCPNLKRVWITWGLQQMEHEDGRRMTVEEVFEQYGVASLKGFVRLEMVTFWWMYHYDWDVWPVVSSRTAQAAVVTHAAVAPQVAVAPQAAVTPQTMAPRKKRTTPQAAVEDAADLLREDVARAGREMEIVVGERMEGWYTMAGSEGDGFDAYGDWGICRQWKGSLDWEVFLDALSGLEM